MKKSKKRSSKAAKNRAAKKKAADKAEYIKVADKKENMFFRSSKALSDPLSLAVCGILLALNITLSYFGNISVTFIGTNVIKLSFTAIPVAIAAMLYGPVCAAILGGLTDVIGFVLAPMGAYIPGFTISMILTGIVYGAAFYGGKCSLPRLLAAQAVVSIFINELLGSLWFVLFYGFQPIPALTVRGIKELLMYPICVFLIYVSAKVINETPDLRKIAYGKSKAR